MTRGASLPIPVCLRLSYFAFLSSGFCVVLFLLGEGFIAPPHVVE